MRLGCGCSKITIEPFEFEIKSCEVPQRYSNCLLLPNTNDEDWDKLQLKIICDFLKVIKQLECGIQPDIELILEEISLIYMNNCKYGVTKKMLATDPEEDNFLRHLNYLSEFATLEEKDLVLMNLGIYDTIRDIVTKDELDNTIDETVNEINNTIDLTTTEINNTINNNVLIINNNIDNLNSLLNTKIGFVEKVERFYYGFASRQTYELWILEGSNTSSNLILARWVGNDYIPNQYTVVFDVVGGNPVESIVVTEGYSILSLPIPVWNDGTMTFDGWYLNEDYTGVKYEGGLIYTPTSSVVFFAKWVISVPDTLTMYSFATELENDFTNSSYITILNKDVDTTITNRLVYHYIPSNVSITVTREVFGAHGIETVTIGTYDNTNKVYKIENILLTDENIKYNK